MSANEGHAQRARGGWFTGGWFTGGWFTGRRPSHGGGVANHE